MTHLLAWRSGTRADTRALQHFECTKPATKRKRGGKFDIVHDRMYEWRVQCKIRTFRPPYHAPLDLLIGEDRHGIAAVLMMEQVDGPGQVELCWGAIERRLRGRGGGYADEMMDVAFDDIIGRALEHGVSMLRIFGYIDPDNRPSQRMCRDRGMRHTGDTDDGLQHWALDLQLVDEADLGGIEESPNVVVPQLN